MTEAEWLASAHPPSMLAALRGGASERKLRLYACACARLAWHLLIDDRSRAAVEVAERLADGQAPWEEAVAAFNEAATACLAVQRGPNLSSLTTLWLRRRDDPYTLYRAAAAASFAVADAAGDIEAHIRGESMHVIEAPTRARLLRCVFGNPLRPAALDAACRAPLAVAMARTIYDERHFDELPVLADAMEEAGCASADALAHLRARGPHVRGCWVIDLLLGKQ
jgi:hypothetical protein